MLSLGQHFLGYMTRIELSTIYSIQGCPSPFLFLLSTPNASVTEKLGEEVWFTVGGQHICFGDSPQDVWTVLGRPCAIHKKEVDQMGIHCTSDHQLRTTLSGDYFYNYFTRGFDILFDGKTHTIKKFILHPNYPGHADFNSYSKCNFIICNPDYDGSFQHEVVASKCSITPSTKWVQVKEILGDCSQTRYSSTRLF